MKDNLITLEQILEFCKLKAISEPETLIDLNSGHTWLTARIAREAFTNKGYDCISIHASYDHLEIDGLNPETQEMEYHLFDVDEQWAVMNKRATSQNKFVESHFRSDKISPDMRSNKVFSYEDVIHMIETEIELTPLPKVI